VSLPHSHREDVGPPTETPGHAVKTWIFSVDGIRSVDRAAMQEFGIPGVVLMENAARHLAEIVLEQLDVDDLDPPRIAIICGTGNNGGDGYAAARHLHNAGCTVMIVKFGTPRAGTDAAVNHGICKSMHLRFVEPAGGLDEFEADLVIDALFGTGLDREVEGTARSLIEWMNTQTAPIVAADIPSGLNADTGEPMGLAVRASTTVTFVGIKTGMLELSAQPWVGDLVIVDIGAPVELNERFGSELDVIPSDDEHEHGQHPPPSPGRR
jgi:NAD(P)H-hydrate epimerase